MYTERPDKRVCHVMGYREPVLAAPHSPSMAHSSHCLRPPREIGSWLQDHGQDGRIDKLGPYRTITLQEPRQMGTQGVYQNRTSRPEKLTQKGIYQQKAPQLPKAYIMSCIG